MSNEPTRTLVELLDSFAHHHQERATSPDEDGMSKWIHAGLAQQARSAAVRLRDEMGRAKKRTAPVADFTSGKSITLCALERINGTPEGAEDSGRKRDSSGIGAQKETDPVAAIAAVACPVQHSGFECGPYVGKFCASRIRVASREGKP